MVNQAPVVSHRQPKKNDLLQPFLKWAGGKRQLLPHIRKHVPYIAKGKAYYEPFVGAGAVLFELQHPKAFINDVNSELINCYQVIKDDVEALIEDIKTHQTNSSEYFYKIREQDRLPAYKEWSPVQRASRIIFLNKTCYNGLFRVNSQGHFNAPFGNYKNPTLVDVIVIKAISKYLNQNNITITRLDFEEAVQGAKKGDFVYFDPPYDPVSDTASFTGYNLDKFGKDEQVRLKTVYDELNARGCKVMLSNSSTDFIKNLYKDYKIITIPANRNINSVGTGRGQINEFLILNYDSDIEK
jgi:DNA adenine methylase